MAYHFYPNWVGHGQQTQENYSNRNSSLTCRDDAALLMYSRRLPAAPNVHSVVLEAASWFGGATGCQDDLKGVSNRVFVTEAGADLSKPNKDYEQSAFAPSLLLRLLLFSCSLASALALALSAPPRSSSHRVFNCTAWTRYDPSGKDGNVNSLRGLDDCLSAMKNSGEAVLGVFPWHGYNNGDSYDFFGTKNGNGRAKMQLIQQRS
jgi:hypothetical protein